MSFLKRIAHAVEEELAENVPGAAFLEKAVERLPEGIERTRDEIVGILHPNHRHNAPDEMAQDAIMAKINASHRFQSFATERVDNFVKWHIDGHNFFWALSEMIDSAQEVIMIQDWWLSPEVYLRRPPAHHPEWRLDRLLKRKAEQGVKIHVIVYKEVTQTMTMSSKHTKNTLENLHNNISCMRHPDHIGAVDTVQFWSHHEKVVVVDNHTACIGGLDLCFGRWDTCNHPLADVHPIDFSRTLFPGQDYNNARILDFHDVPNYVSNSLSILEFARMPWHDVSMTVSGPAVLDIVQHFTERWNEVKKRKYKEESRYPWLALPHNVAIAPNEAVIFHPLREKWHAIGRHYRDRFHVARGQGAEPGYSSHPHGTCRVQVVRSVSDWSHGVLTEHSIQNAYIQLILEANHHIYIENQFFISNTIEGEGPVKNLIAKALVDRIVTAARDGIKFKVVVVIPEVPGFAGNIKDESALKTILAAQWRTINRGGHSIYEEIRKAGYEPTDYIRFYHLRSYDRINAPYPSFISKMEENSGVKFQEAQVALARQWLGDQDIKDINIETPSPTKEGINISDKTEIHVEKVHIPESFEAATQVVRKFEKGVDGLGGGLSNINEVKDNFTHQLLDDGIPLEKEKWLGSEEEELNCYVSELLYIHTKLMVVDDRRVIMGSANLNDRSQRGDGDSEIALVVEDGDMIRTTMNEKPYQAARFAASLRRKLYREHLGLVSPVLCQTPNEEVTSFMRPAPIPNDDETSDAFDEVVADPLADSTLGLWNDTARKNREIFTEIFRPVLSNLVQNWNAYDNYVPKVKTGHVAPGIPLDRLKSRLSEVKGSLIEAPLDFLIEDKSLVEGPEWGPLNPTLPIYL